MSSIISAANEKLKMTKEMDRLSERLSGLERDFTQANEDRLRHLEEANTSEESAIAAKREAETAVRKHNKEVSVLVIL